MNRILGILAVALLAFGLAACNGEEDNGGGGSGGSTGPEISVSRGAVTLSDGGADALGSTPFGTPQTLSYTLDNTGSAALNLTGTPVVQTASAVNCSANVTTQATTPVAASGSTNFVVSLTVTSAAAFSVRISIANDDSNENPFDFTISGTGATVPEIDVQRPAATSIADGGTDNVGGGFVTGANPAITWTIANSGSAVLTLSGGPNFVTTNNLNNCTVGVTQPGSATVAASGSQTFQIAITVTAAGAFSFQFHISSDDADESPYDVTVSGSVPIPVPEIDVQRPASTSIADGGGDNAGTLNIGANPAMTWTIANTGGAALTLTGGTPVTTNATSNCSVVVTQPAVSSVAAASSTTFQITITTGGAGAFSFQFHVASNDADENPYDVTVSGTAASGPSLTVFTQRALVTASGTVSLGRLGQEATAIVPVMLRNSGSGALTITSATTSGPVNATASVRDAAPASVGAGDTGSFTVLLNAQTSGNPSCVVTIISNDPVNPTFTFTLSATLVTSTSALFVSSGSSGTNLTAATFPGASTLTVLNGAVAALAAGVSTFHHLMDRAVFIAQLASPGPTDIFLRGIPPALPSSPQNLTGTLTGATGVAGNIKFTSGDNFAFTVQSGTVTRLYTVTLSGATAGTPIEVSGTLPSGSPSGVFDFWPSPRGDGIVFMGDFTTAGTYELYHVPTGGGTRTKVNATLTAGRRVAFNAVQWLSDNSGVIHETENTSGQLRELYLSQVSPTFTTTKLNGTVPASHTGVKPLSARVSVSSSHVFFISDEGGATNRNELYVVSLIGGISGATGLNGATVPGFNTFVSDYGINNTGTKVIFVADSGPLSSTTFQYAKELFFSAIAGSTPTTAKIVTSALADSVGVVIDPARSVFSTNKAYYTRDDLVVSRQELFFLDLSAGTPPSTKIPGLASFPAGSAGVAISNVLVRPDGSQLLFTTDQGAGTSGAVLDIASFSATPATARLSSNASQHSPGNVTLLNNRVWFTKSTGGTDTPLFSMLITDAPGTEVTISGAEVSGAMGGVTEIKPFNTNRVIYHYFTIAYDGVANANCTGAITRTIMQGGGAAAAPTSPTKIGTDTLP